MVTVTVPWWSRYSGVPRNRTQLVDTAPLGFGCASRYGGKETLQDTVTAGGQELMKVPTSVAKPI